MTVMEHDPLTPIKDNISELAVLPHVVFSILEPVGPDEPTASQLEKIVAVDPGFATKALVLANTGAFGRPRTVASLSDCVEMLGFRTLRTLAMTAGTFEMFIGKNDPFSLRRRRWWRHSVDSAIACKWLAKESHRANPEEAYTAGLMHLLGKCLLDRYGGQDYSLVTERQASGERDWEAERTVFGCDHSELLAHLARTWWLPENLVEAFQYQREPEFGHEYQPLRACVAIGTRLASAACRGPELGQADLADCPQWALGILGLSRDQLRFVLEEGIDAIASYQVQR